MTMLESLTDIAHQAGRLLLQLWKTELQLKNKRQGDATQDPVTIADTQSQELIIQELKSRFPDVPIVAEEQANPKITASRFFAVDPLDGTKNYSRQASPYWGLSIGLVEDFRPKAGVIHLPAHNITVVAERGQGCFLNGERVHFKPEGLLPHMVIGTEIGHWWKEEDVPRVLAPLMIKSWGARSILSAVVSIVELLQGVTGAYVNLNVPGKGIKIWDVVAGAVMVEEAGGVVKLPDGSDPQWNQVPMEIVMAANSQLMEEILEITRV